jgi:hypothetical protein
MVPGFSSLLYALVAFACLNPALGATYSRSDSVSGSGFLNAFSYQAIADPTHGRVYVGPLTDLWVTV